jgi:hypothetical protein
MTQQVQSSQAPIHTIESQMLCQPVFQLISPLLQMSIALISRTYGLNHAHCPVFEYSSRVDLQQASDFQVLFACHLVLAPMRET